MTPLPILVRYHPPLNVLTRLAATYRAIKTRNKNFTTFVRATVHYRHDVVIGARLSDVAGVGRTTALWTSREMTSARTARRVTAAHTARRVTAARPG